MRSQGQKDKVRLQAKGKTQAFYRRLTGRCVFALSWQQFETVSYGEQFALGSADASDFKPSQEERLPPAGRTTSTFLHLKKENALTANMDPWKLRDRFLLLDLHAGPELAIRLRDFLGGAGFVHDIAVGKKLAFPLPPEQISEWQERQRFLKRWLELAPGKCGELQSEFPKLATYAVNGCGAFPSNMVSMTWQDALPVVTWTVRDAWSAMVAAVHFDKMRGVRLRWCKVCRRPVPPTQRTPYCGKTCRHTATMRRLRAN